MELIPVISAIISAVTFLLVIIAFVIYKVRIKKREKDFYPAQLKNQTESKPSKDYEGTEQYLKAADYRPYNQAKQNIPVSEFSKPKEAIRRNLLKNPEQNRDS